jgi:hypothetical protein
MKALPNSNVPATHIRGIVISILCAAYGVFLGTPQEVLSFAFLTVLAACSFNVHRIEKDEQVMVYGLSFLVFCIAVGCYLYLPLGIVHLLNVIVCGYVGATFCKSVPLIERERGVISLLYISSFLVYGLSTLKLVEADVLRYVPAFCLLVAVGIAAAQSMTSGWEHFLIAASSVLIFISFFPAEILFAEVIGFFVLQAGIYSIASGTRSRLSAYNRTTMLFSIFFICFIGIWLVDTFVQPLVIGTFFSTVI